MRVFSVFVVACFCISEEIMSQQYGCTDPRATNFDPVAVINDGSCTYPFTSYSPDFLFNLNSRVKETSGLVFIEGKIWTHNDSGNSPDLYQLDPLSGEILKTVRVRNAKNIDWEDIALDDDYIYIGDFGNNNGDRKDLHILRISLVELLLSDTVDFDEIHFHYPDQTDFSIRPQNHDFDAEALISYGEHLYVFSKNWVNSQCKIYSMPKEPGTYEANLIGEIPTNGMITGADIHPELGHIALCGYNQALLPFLYFIFDIQENQILWSNKRKIQLALTPHQVEGIAWRDSFDLYISNEEFTRFFTIAPKIFSVNSKEWIGPLQTSHRDMFDYENDFSWHPFFSGDALRIIFNHVSQTDTYFFLYNLHGKCVATFQVEPNAGLCDFSCQHLPSGIYIICGAAQGTNQCQKIIKMK